MSNQDIATICRVLVDVAKALLEERGEFNPFAATMDGTGAAALFGGDMGTEHPKGADLAGFLAGALRARVQQGGIVACGICLNVRARLPGYDGEVDAVCCQIEHVDTRPVHIFVPFRQGAPDRLEYDKPVVLPGQAAVFQTS